MAADIKAMAGGWAYIVPLPGEQVRTYLVPRQVYNPLLEWRDVTEIRNHRVSSLLPFALRWSWKQGL